MTRATRTAALALLAASLAAGSLRADFGDNSVGINIHIPPGDVIDACVDLGVRWVRVDNNWLENQPSSGPPAYIPALDDAVSRAVASGLNVYMTIAYTPAWASSGDTDGTFLNDVPVPGAYEAYVRQAVAHYRAMGVTHYNLWNEPNLDGFWEGTSAQYVDLIVAPGMTAVDRGCMDAGFTDCLVLGPELAHVGEFDVWLEEILTRMDGAGIAFDIYSHHIYQGFPETGTEVWDGDRFYNALDQRRFAFTRRSFLDVLAGTGHAGWGVPDREVWITETGYRCEPPTDAAEQATQATYYMRVIDEQLARAWYTNTFFYEIQDSFDSLDGFGIIRRTAGPDDTWADNFEFKDAYDALKARIAAEPAFQEEPCTLQCCDGIDNDGDGMADMGDPGCASSDDDDESDDPVPTREEIQALPGSVALDGVLDEWAGASFIELRFPEDFVSPDHDPAEAAAVSCGFALLWSAEALQLAVEVTDAVHDNANAPDLVWLGDSVQVAFDVANNGGHAYDTTDDYELGWARTSTGDVGYRWTAPASAPADTSSFAIGEGAGTMVYEVRLNAADLGLAAFTEGTLMGFTLLVNNANGEGREGWIEWTPGIGSFKDPAAFGLLRLVTAIIPEPDGEPPDAADDVVPDVPADTPDLVDDVLPPPDGADGADVPWEPGDGGGDGCGCAMVV
jgi:hypothetical protein